MGHHITHTQAMCNFKARRLSALRSVRHWNFNQRDRRVDVDVAFVACRHLGLGCAAGTLRAPVASEERKFV